MKYRHIVAALVASPLALAHPAYAAPKPVFGDPVKVSDTITIDPILDARLRYERVETPTVDADAATLRLRGGFEIKHAPSHLAILAEATGTLGIVTHYNAFPFVIADAQRRPQFAVVPDAQNVDLNRLQIQYKTKQVSLTLGRQRINLDDQRWVGAVGWRQTEQTFDAVRGEVTVGPVSLDGTYANKQHTVFSYEAGPRRLYEGDFLFLGAGVKAGPVLVKGFAYLLDYDTREQVGALATGLADTQTYGARASGALPLSKAVKFTFAASYARQSSWKQAPVHYAADYIAAEAGLGYKGWSLSGGYEKLGSDHGRAVQSPMATLHKFNGWADLFLTTPNTGLQDTYVTLAKVMPKVKALPGLNANVTWHRFDSDVGSVRFGDEWDASLGFKVRKVSLLAKFADYRAKGFGVNTRKFWLEADYAF
jgi:hypothetical protein